MLTQIKKMLALPGEVEKLKASNQSLKGKLKELNGTREELKELQELVGKKEEDFASIYDRLYRRDGWGNLLWTSTSTNKSEPKDLTLVEKVEQMMNLLEIKEEKSFGYAETKLVKVVKPAAKKKTVRKK